MSRSRKCDAAQHSGKGKGGGIIYREIREERAKRGKKRGYNGNLIEKQLSLE